MSFIKKYLTSLFCGDEDEEVTARKDFATSAAELVEPIIRQQGFAKALHDEFSSEVNKINALLKKSGIDKTIEWEISGEDSTGLTLASRAENSYKEHLVLEASASGSFFSSLSREVCSSPASEVSKFANRGTCHYLGSNGDKHIDIVNAVIQNHILTEDEMKKVGFTVYEQAKQANAPHGHSRPTPGLEIKGP